MSTVSVANIHFESTGNNRIQIEGTNTSIYQAGRLLMTANSTEMTVNYNNSTTPLVSTFNNGKSLNNQYAVGDMLTVFNVDPTFSAEFNNSSNSYTADQATISIFNTYIRLTATSTDPKLRTPTISYFGADIGKIIVKIRRIAGSGWDGSVYYQTAGHSESGSFRMLAPQPTWNGTDWAYVELDGSNLFAGGNDFITNIITSIRFDFGSTASDIFDIDYIRFYPVNATNVLKTLTPINFVNTEDVLSRSQYPALSTVMGNSNIDVTRWYNRTPANTFGINGVTYGNGIFVAVSTNGAIQSSTDGVTWTSRTGANTLTQLAVTFGNGIFVSTGNAGSIQTSTDAITWTNQTRANTLSQRGITFGNGVYVAAGGNGSVATIVSSTDAITWTNRTPANANIIYGVAYGNGVFVTVGDNGTVQSSTDAITWTNRTRANTTSALVLYSVTYGNGIFVAVGGDGDGNASIQTSTDGTTWTNRIIDADQVRLRGISYNTDEGVYVAGGYTDFGTSFPGRIQTSTDAITWTNTTPSSTNFINYVTYGNGVFVAVSGNGTLQSTLSHATEFMVYSPYTSPDATIKTFVRAS